MILTTLAKKKSRSIRPRIDGFPGPAVARIDLSRRRVPFGGDFGRHSSAAPSGATDDLRSDPRFPPSPRGRRGGIAITVIKCLKTAKDLASAEVEPFSKSTIASAGSVK